MKSFGVEKNQSFGYISGPDLLDYENIRFLIHGIIDITTHKIGTTCPNIVLKFKHKYPPVMQVATTPFLNIVLEDTTHGIHLRFRPTYKRFTSWDGVFENMRNDAILGHGKNGYRLREIDFDYKVPVLNVIKEKVVYKTEYKTEYVEIPFIDALKKENERLYKELEDYRAKDSNRSDAFNIDNSPNLAKIA